MMIQQQPFGRTGHLSTRLLFGAAAFFTAIQEDADRTMEIVLEYGINHIDTAASYGNAEVCLGPWIEKHREKFFLATKTGERSYSKAMEEIQRSLERMRTDHVDLLQLHAVIEEDERQAVLGPGGALEAALDAKRQGLIQFIGITSHSLSAPGVHLKSLEVFDFDSVLLPWNYMLSKNQIYAAQFHQLLEICREKNVAVQLIKTLLRRPWGDVPQNRSTWYQPLEEPRSIERGLSWAFSFPGTFINTPGDMALLPIVLDSAGRIDQPPSEGEMEEMLTEYEMVSLW
jgi:aryl-alcohol dehydrogenase-like predicted oxidoreductase